jgi:hypothetical protein
MYEETKLAVAGFIQNKSFKKEREGGKSQKQSQTDTPRPTKRFPLLPKRAKIHQDEKPNRHNLLAGRRRRRRRRTASKHKSFPRWQQGNRRTQTEKREEALLIAYAKGDAPGEWVGSRRRGGRPAGGVHEQEDQRESPTWWW